MKVLIAYVAPDFKVLVYAEALRSVWDIDKGDHWLDLIFLTGVPLAGQGDANLGYNLERARQVAISLNYDYMLIIESDIIVPRECLIKLIAMDADVAIGLTPERYEKCKTFMPIACMEWNNNPDAMKGVLTKKPFEIKGCAGYTLTLVKRKVFEKMPFPAKFPCDFIWYASLHEAEVNILCDPTVLCFHVERIGRVAKGLDSLLGYWKIYMRQNELEGRAWYYGLADKWWWGMSKDQFLSNPSSNTIWSPEIKEFEHVELGGGSNPKFHPNLDAVKSQGVDWVIDLNKEDLPLFDATIGHVYASHFIEHFTYKRALELMVDSYRVLKSGGVLELVIPDTEKGVRNNATMTPELSRIIFGERTNPFQHHYSWWSQDLARSILASIGFAHVNIADERTGTEPCFNVQAIKQF